MKKFLSNICAFILIFASVMLGFSFAQNKKFAYAVEENAEVPQILEGIVLAQDGHVFSRNDFEYKSGAYYLYVNSTITITNVGSNRLLVSYTGVNTEIVSGGYHSIHYDEHAAESKKYISLSLQNTPTTGDKSFPFYLIQTPNHYKVNPSFYWTDSTPVTPAKRISAPFNINQKFAKFLTLNGIDGTTECPIYIDVYYNGEFYSFYSTVNANNEHKFYSTITGNELNLDPSQGIKFDAAGTYEIYIYDKTAYGSMKEVTIDKSLFPSKVRPAEDVTFHMLDLSKINAASFANVQGYAFTINETEKNDMYITATDIDGNNVLNGQIANQNVHLSFHNLSTTAIGKITLTTISYGSARKTITIAEVGSEIRDLEQYGYDFDKDGTYLIQFYDKNGGIIKPPYNSETGSEYDEQDKDENATMFAFRLIKDIQTSYESISVKEVNKIETYHLQSVIVRWLTCTKEKITSGELFHWEFLKGVNPYSFSVSIAKPEIKITGVANGANANTDLKLHVYGVGKIEVVVVKDTTTTTYNLHNGDLIPNTATVGNYTVTMTDQMGNTMTVSFAVKQALNTATIVLIVVGAAILGIIIFLIVRTRTKIQVR